MARVLIASVLSALPSLLPQSLAQHAVATKPNLFFNELESAKCLSSPGGGDVQRKSIAKIAVAVPSLRRWDQESDTGGRGPGGATTKA